MNQLNHILWYVDSSRPSRPQSLVNYYWSDQNFVCALRDPRWVTPNSHGIRRGVYTISTALLCRPESGQDRNVMLEMNELNNKLPSMRISYSSRCLFNSNLRRRKRVGSGIAKRQVFHCKVTGTSSVWMIPGAFCVEIGSFVMFLLRVLDVDVDLWWSMIILFSSPIYWKIPTLKT